MDADAEDLVRSREDPPAFEHLVGRHSVALHGYLARRAPAAADDLLADVWLTAFRRRRDFDPRRGCARGWLFGIARVLLLAHRRTAVAAVRIPSQGIEALSADGWEAVDARLDAAAMAPALRAALATLAEPERELLLLVAWEQLTPTEAAEALCIPAPTARSRLHRARLRMRAALSPLAPAQAQAAPDQPPVPQPADQGAPR